MAGGTASGCEPALLSETSRRCWFGHLLATVVLAMAAHVAGQLANLVKLSAAHRTAVSLSPPEYVDATMVITHVALQLH